MSQQQAWEDRSVDTKQWREVGQELGLNELQLRALTSRGRQPQAIDGEKWLLVNFHFPELKRVNLRTHRLSVLLSEDRVITLHNDVLDPELEEYIMLHPQFRSSPSGILAMIADVATERVTPILDQIDQTIDDLEDRILDNPSNKDLDKLFNSKKNLSDLRRIVMPMMQMMDSLSNRRFDVIEEKYIPYLRDSYDYAWRAHELIETLRDLLSSVLDTYLTASSNRMNEVMKRLTIVTTIFMPISFLASLGGINFMQFPFESDMAYTVMMTAMIVIPVLMFVYFKRKEWL